MAELEQSDNHDTLPSTYERVGIESVETSYDNDRSGGAESVGSVLANGRITQDNARQGSSQNNLYKTSIITGFVAGVILIAIYIVINAG